MLKTKFLPCLPPVTLCLIDQAATLRGQSARYWQGRFQEAQEACPHGLELLRWHPGAYLLAVVGYMVVFSVIIALLPRRGALFASVGLTMGHAWGASTWLGDGSPRGYWLCLALNALASILIVATWERSPSSSPIFVRSAPRRGRSGPGIAIDTPSLIEKGA